MEQKRKGKPPRLERIFQKHDPPLFLVTFNTHGRRHLLATNSVHAAFVTYCRRASGHGIGVGRYVIMPDHVHVFVRLGVGSETILGAWIKGLKRHLDLFLAAAGNEPLAIPDQKLRSFWQPGFFDHLLRHDKSYAAKWNYVRENPVRAGLVTRAEDWPYAGGIISIDRA